MISEIKRRTHTVEKIGGTSMSDYGSVKSNIILNKAPASPFGRIIVVSAYGGITNKLLEDKKSGQPGIYGLFASSVEDGSWQHAFDGVLQQFYDINASLFRDGDALAKANAFIAERMDDAHQCLSSLQGLCRHGHFAVETHLATVREMLASIGEAHSAWNTAQLLQRDDVPARFVDLTGWRDDQHRSLDERITKALADMDLQRELPIVTGYAHCETGLMKTFNRGYSEMIFSRLAVLSGAREAIIHKEFHLSSADPRLVGTANAVPIGRTNYDVADQLANLGMEAIHPKAATGLREQKIPLRVKNTFEPEHAGTLITGDYTSDSPCVEIIAGCKGIYAIEVFDQNMVGNLQACDRELLSIIHRFRGHIVAKDINANTITHYLSTNLKTARRICALIGETFPEAEINQKKVALVSAIGSDMQIPGILARTVKAAADSGINILAMHQSMRQVDMQLVVNESDYEKTVKSLHQNLVEIHEHGPAICLAS